MSNLNIWLDYFPETRELRNVTGIRLNSGDPSTSKAPMMTETGKDMYDNPMFTVDDYTTCIIQRTRREPQRYSAFLKVRKQLDGRYVTVCFRKFAWVSRDSLFGREVVSFEDFPEIVKDESSQRWIEKERNGF